MCYLLENIYNRVQLHVCLPNGIINLFTSNIGLKQGCNLSIILFNLSLCQPPKIYQLTLNNPLYVDDLVLPSEIGCLGLQNCLDKLQQYCHK